MKTRARFNRPDARLILPQALSEEWPNRSTPDVVEPPSEAIGVLVIRGPLEHHRDPEFDSYDSILCRAAAIFEAAPSFVVMFLDSPGGVVSGCFPAARELRRLSEASGIPLYAYIEGAACSAAYALACSASMIMGPPESVSGSVGVIADLADQTRRDAAQGVLFHFVTSGARKADGHDHAPVTKDVLASVQKHVAEEAEMFWAWVAERRGLSVDAVVELEAAHFHGAEAVSKGLIDRVSSLDDALAAFAEAEATAAMSGTSNGANMAKNIADARKILGEVAGGDGEEAALARRMLEAADGEPKKDEEAPPEKKEGEPEPDVEDEAAEDTEVEDEAAAATAGASAEDEPKDDEAKAKRCEDEAKAEDEEARRAARKAEEADARARSAKTLAEAKAAMREATSLRARASRSSARAADLRDRADIRRRLATRAVVTPAKPKATVAAKIAGGLAAAAARGTEVKPKGGAKPPTTSATARKAISEVAPEIRRAAGIPTDAAADPLVRFDEVGMSIGARFSDPKTAREYLATAGKAGA